MTKKVLTISALTLLILFLFTFMLGQFPLWSSDEGRYGAIARSMWESKDFITPHFNSLPYLEKPVLAPLLTSFAYGIFGVNEFASRFTSALAALLGILLTFFFVRRIFGKETALFTVLVLASTIGFVLVGRFAVIDMLMTLLLTLTMFSLVLAYSSENKYWYLASYFFMGLGLLTKGLIAILLPGLIFFVFLVWNRRLGEILKMKLVWGILILAAVAAPWFIAISQKHPDFFNTFILKHHFARFSTGTFGRSRPFWFFIPVFFAIAFPWSFFTPAAVASSMRRPAADQWKQRLLISWITVVFVFFSIPKSKLPYYLLPISIPFAIMIADFFTNLKARLIAGDKPSGLIRWTWLIVFALIVIATIALNITLPFLWKRPEVSALRLPLFIGTLLMAVGFGAAYFASRKNQITKAVAWLAASVYVGLIVTIISMKIITPLQSTHAFAEAVNAVVKPTDKVAVLASPDQYADFIFYLDKRVIIVGSDYGTLAPQSGKLDKYPENVNYFLSREDFVKVFNQKDMRVFCLLKKKHLSDLTNIGIVGYTTIKEDKKRILISNQ